MIEKRKQALTINTDMSWLSCNHLFGSNHGYKQRMAAKVVDQDDVFDGLLHINPGNLVLPSTQDGGPETSEAFQSYILCTLRMIFTHNTADRYLRLEVLHWRHSHEAKGIIGFEVYILVVFIVFLSTYVLQKTP